MALNVVNKINNKLKFLYRKNSFLTPALRRLLCNALIQPHFDYACSAWYPNLTKKLKHRIQTTQNKCIRFCLQLDKLKHLSHEEFEGLNWLPVTYIFKQCVNIIAFKYFNEQCPNYLNEVFNVAAENNFQLRGSFQKFQNVHFVKLIPVKLLSHILVQLFGIKLKILIPSNIIWKNISYMNLKIVTTLFKFNWL